MLFLTLFSIGIEKGKDKYSVCCCYAAIHEALNSLFDYTLCAPHIMCTWRACTYVTYLFWGHQNELIVLFSLFDCNKTFGKFLPNQNTRHEITISPWAMPEFIHHSIIAIIESDSGLLCFEDCIEERQRLS